jgi:transcriptional regulator with XRE-family HTH domain
MIRARGKERPVEAGDRLRALIGESGLTQVQAAQALWTDQGSLSKILKGTQLLTIEMAEWAAYLFQVRAGWILFGEADTPEEIAAAAQRGRVLGLQEAADLLRAHAQQVATTPVAGTPKPASRVLDRVATARGKKPDQKQA